MAGKVSDRIRADIAGCIALLFALGFATAGPVAADADDAMGIYRVTDGHLKQSFKYDASSYSVHHVSGDCWEFHYNSDGSGSWDLKAVAKAKQKGVKGKVVKPVFDNGVFKLRGLGWSGAVARQTDIRMQTRPGQGYDEDCDPPDHPPPDTFGCGASSVDGYVKPELVPYDGRYPIIDNTSEPQHRMGLFGEMPQPLDLYPCPSESTFASLVGGGRGDLSRSDVKLKAFERFEKKIKLAGKSQYSGNQYFFFAGFEDGSGSQEASTSWSLKLKCVDRC
jgi:hypothetical protein